MGAIALRCVQRKRLGNKTSSKLLWRLRERKAFYVQSKCGRVWVPNLRGPNALGLGSFALDTEALAASQSGILRERGLQPVSVVV
jgi:hypothetical protein